MNWDRLLTELYAEMERLNRKPKSDLDHLPIHDTQLGLEFAFEFIKTKLNRTAPVTNIVWLQSYNGVDDAIDYYAVAISVEDKCVDGSPPFPVWAAPVDITSRIWTEVNRTLDDDFHDFTPRARDKIREAIERATGTKA